MSPTGKLKICVIDDGISLSALEAALSFLPAIHRIHLNSGRNAAPENGTVSHGTVCMGLLCEFLQRARLLNAVELFSVSLLNQQGVQTIEMLEKALCWCFSHSIDLVCLSAGAYRYCAARRMSRMIQQHKKCVIVAAQANEGAITYPASLPEVLGVRYARQLPPGQIRFVRRPLDGIELETALPESRVLQALGCGGFTANSFTPPYLAAQLIHLWKEKQSAWNFHKLRNSLAGALSSASFSKSNPAAVPPTELPPVVLFPYYMPNKKTVRRLVYNIQRLFLQHEYDCAVLDASCSSRISRHRFRLPASAGHAFFEQIVFLSDPGILLVTAPWSSVRKFLSQGCGTVLAARRRVWKIQSAAPFFTVKIKEPLHGPLIFYHWLLQQFAEPQS